MKAPFLFRKGQTNVGMLYQFVLLIVLVGMIIGVGIITLDAFGSSTYYQRTNYNDSATTITIFNESYALDFGNLTNIGSVLNASGGAYTSKLYTIDAANGSIRFTHNDSGEVLLGASVNVIYDFKDYNTETATAAAAVSAEIANIATDWVGLIVTIFVLAIILGLVLLSFRPGMERG